MRRCSPTAVAWWTGKTCSPTEQPGTWFGLVIPEDEARIVPGVDPQLTGRLGPLGT